MKQTFSEQQIIQMAQQEEAVLQSKQKYLQQLNRVLTDVVLGIQGLKEIQKKPENVMVKLGPGIMVEAKITDTTNCMRAFADNGFSKASIKDTITWLEDKQKNVETQIQKVNIDLAKSKQKLNELIGIIKQIETEKSKNISGK
jgi:prefoldin subunit 5